MIPVDSPFHPDNPGYLLWRETKLRDYPQHVEALVVEVADPKSLRPSEKSALQQRCGKSNMAIYVGPARDQDKSIPRLLGTQFGLEHLDAHWLADEDEISTLTVAENGSARGEFIPYTNRPIRWHTDGYYNPSARRILGMMLHCASPAADGGENQLLDHEILYLLLRDENPEHIRALMQDDAMSIPPRLDDDGIARDTETGPVFSTLAGGQLHMRYTARTRSIAWKQDSATQAAVAAIERLLAQELPWIFSYRLQAGMGLLCNNVLHNRAGFVDSAEQKRVMYRARYYDRIAGT